MGSHRHPDDDPGDETGDLARGGREFFVGGTGSHHVVPGDSGADRDTGAGSDHFGLFDDGPRPTARGATPTGDIDLSDLRDVLAGRRDAESLRDRHSGASRNDEHHARAKTRRRHPVRSTVIALLVLLLISGGVTGGVLWWQQRTTVPVDWAGTGTRAVVIRVQSGDGLFDVGQTLVKAGVVASVETFVTVATDDGSLSALQPGFYRVHVHSSAQSAVDDLAQPDSRLGQLRIIPGETLADITKVSTTGEKSTKLGILSEIARACVPTDGADRCFTVDELWKVAETGSAADLGVVAWAVDAFDRAPEPRRRLEGLILPGDYSIAPGSTAQQALKAVVSASASEWNTTGIVAAAAQQHRTAYELATVASLVQAEGTGSDMRKIARVIDNRLQDGIKLQFDSTVNYGLDRASISTTSAERLDQANLYSTYAHAGLTPTPIGAPGPEALDAADDPATGNWLYFVTIDLDGTTCFSVTLDEHETCVATARANGVFG